MKRVILKGPDFCAVTEDGRMAEYIPLDRNEQSGDILLGRVERLMPGMNCAFVDIGRQKSGFLPMDENGKTFQDGKLRSGEELILQIRKEETGGKGAFLSRDITISGTYVILMPKNRYIGISNRIENESERERMKQIGRDIAGNRFGLVMRHSALQAKETEILKEAEDLYAAWNETVRKASAGGMPGTVLRHSGVLEALQNDYNVHGIEEMCYVSELTADQKRQLDISGKRAVLLPHGGNIMIDRCEAMTVIDVNTASSNSANNKERTILETNLEACEEIALQARIRDLSGIIIIDFIDMMTETDRSLVSERLKECFLRDRIKTVIHGWTKLGLMEMTRKRR